MFNKKIKTYTFDKFGLAQAKYDIAMEKKNRINKITSIAMMLLFAGVGFMSKEFIILYLINLGIGVTTDFLIQK